MPTNIALWRGINVGRAKRLAMADVRSVLQELGYDSPRTVLQSGNAAFESAAPLPDGAAEQIRDAVLRRSGVRSEVVLVTAEEFTSAVEDNPLLNLMVDPSRLFVAFLADPADRAALAPWAERSWSPDVCAVGARVAYLWCPSGAATSTMLDALGRLALEGTVTVRNWNTVGKIAKVAG